MSSTSDTEGLGFDTRAIHAGQPPDPVTGAVVTPISLATTFAQEEVGKHGGFEYARSDNPTRRAYETCLASLEGAAHGLAFASGLAAEDAVLRLLRPGDHIVIPNDAYGGTFRLVARVHAPAGIEWSAADLGDPAALEAVWRDSTRMVWIETPTNPMLAVVDIAQVAATAHARGALVVVDNTFATPYLQLPLHEGADIVVHSATKYLGGHSDVVGGFLALDDDVRRGAPLPAERRRRGAVAVRLLSRAPRAQDARRAHGSPLRERGRGRRAARAAPGGRTGDVSGVERAPRSRRRGPPDAGLRRHGLVHRAGRRAGRRRPRRAPRVFTLAESLGAVESLIEHPGRMTHASAAGSPLEVHSALVRLSVGLETVDDLLADLRAALDFVA